MENHRSGSSALTDEPFDIGEYYPELRSLSQIWDIMRSVPERDRNRSAGSDTSNSKPLGNHAS